jgi:hypothetical protein
MIASQWRCSKAGSQAQALPALPALVAYVRVAQRSDVRVTTLSRGKSFSFQIWDFSNLVKAASNADLVSLLAASGSTSHIKPNSLTIMGYLPPI